MLYLRNSSLMKSDYTLQNRFETTFAHYVETNKLFTLYWWRLNQYINNRTTYNTFELQANKYLHQLLNIKITILFDKNGKHGIQKLFNVLIGSKPSKELDAILAEWNNITAKHQNFINQLKNLRDKVYAHLDIPDGSLNHNVVINEYIELMNIIQYIIFKLWHYQGGDVPEPFDSEEYQNNISYEYLKTPSSDDPF